MPVKSLLAARPALLGDWDRAAAFLFVLEEERSLREGMDVRRRFWILTGTGVKLRRARARLESSGTLLRDEALTRDELLLPLPLLLRDRTLVSLSDTRLLVLGAWLTL